jgi:hypothetical protein
MSRRIRYGNQSHFNSTSGRRNRLPTPSVYRRRNPAGISEGRPQVQELIQERCATVGNPEQESHWESTIVEQLGATA